jgi:uncharacterized protein
VGKRTKVTLDTNILVSALGWRGNPHRILQKVVNGEIELFVSHEQFEELTKVLNYPKFDFTEEQKERFKALISAIATFVEPKTRLDIVKEDPSDNRILECAQVADVDFIVSGDEHLLHLGNLGRIRIVKASEFLR